MPEGVDPCDFIATHGSDPFRQLLDPSGRRAGTQIQSGDQRIGHTHRYASRLASRRADARHAGPDSADRRRRDFARRCSREEQMLSRIARKFHLPEEKLRSRLTSLRREAQRRKSRRTQSTARRRRPNRPASADCGSPILPAWDRDLLELDASRSDALSPRVGRVDRADATSLRRRPANLRRLLPARRGRLARRFRPPAGRVRRAGHEEPARRSSTNRARPKPRPTANAGWPTCWKRIAAAAKKPADRADLAAARQDDDDAEQLLAQFCEQSKSKHLSEYERRKK